MIAQSQAHTPSRACMHVNYICCCLDCKPLMQDSVLLQRPKAAPAEEGSVVNGEVQASEVAEVQAAVELVQKQMCIYDGSFLQFRCDEKGFLSICAFGLPGKTHEDSPSRAIQAGTAPCANATLRMMLLNGC